jgi:ribosomal protein S18 acetylase RimI-like enzyme
MMLFATATLAARIERAESRLACDFAEAARHRRDDVVIRPLGGTAAIFAGPDQPFNKIVGLGFDEKIDLDVLEQIEREFDALRAPIRVEQSILADPSVASLLTSRGYGLVGFENVLAIELTPARVADAAAHVQAHQTRGITVSNAGSDERGAWRDALISGFEHPDLYDGPPSDESFPRESIEAVFGDYDRIPGIGQYLGRRSGVIAGAAAMRVWNGLAQLCGAATRPEHRRNGVQSAMLQARLVEAAEHGCDLAVVTTQAGSKSQENVQRAGFELLYTRAILVRAPGTDGGASS